MERKRTYRILANYVPPERMFTLFFDLYAWYIDTLDGPANNQANQGGPVKDYDI